MCDDKTNAEKHKKYIDFYLGKDRRTPSYDTEEEFWGIGIENESYMMTEKMEEVKSEFLMNNTKRERYSIDYFLNYKMDEYKKTVSYIEKVTVPHYINSYMFQKMDIHGEHKTLYTKGIRMNQKFCGMTIHEYMKYMSKKYTKLFNNNVIFDGDTIEFTTNRFYKTTVNDTVNELNTIKHIFLREVNKYLANKFIFGSDIRFPSHNYGFVKYMSNPNNIGICNSGTYHINITLPTTLSLDGMKIKEPAAFKHTHQNAIRFIQWVEPLIIALYGTPDILSCANAVVQGTNAVVQGTNAIVQGTNAVECANGYSKGSLRLMMSRYIGLGTYDTDTMEPGKKLNDFEYKRDASHYFNQLHNPADSPYNPPETIGYDFNYNKFKNHGIELRVLDYFPEEYLTDVINFIILVCQYSIYNKNIKKPQHSKLWNELVVCCIRQGSEAMVSNELYLQLREIFEMDTECSCFSLLRRNKERTVMKVITKISDFLYDKYSKDTIVQKMSPSMKKMVWVDYNKIMREKYVKAIYP